MKSHANHSANQSHGAALLDWLDERGIRAAHEFDALIHALQVIRRFIATSPRESLAVKRRGKQAAGAVAKSGGVTTGRPRKNAGQGSPSAPSRGEPPPRLPAPVPDKLKYQFERTTREEQAPLIEWIAARLDERGPQSVRDLAIAKCASESEIKRAIAVAGRRFAWNEENDTYRLAG